MGDPIAASTVRPLVGRDRELDRVGIALAETARGQGRVLFLVGHMGMGKTRLAEEALALAGQRQFLLLVGRTPGAGSGLAYAPLLAAFGAVLRSLAQPDRDALAGDLPHLGRLWPELGFSPPPPAQEPELERALLFEAVARLLERLAARSPVALFVDDMHWADGPSLALLGYLLPTVAALPVLLIGTYRPEAVADNKSLRQFLTDARRAGITAELGLEGLDPDGVAALAAGILGDEPPARLLELSAGAGGTPLFVDALVRGLLEAGVLVRTPGGWAMNEEGGANALPRGVQDLVADRLDLLAAEERAIIDLIAHAPQELPHDLLEEVGGMKADRLLELVDRLIGGGLVIQDVAGPEVAYRLAHPLIGEVVEANVPAVAGRRLHARLARTSEVLRPRDLDRLAYHYCRAGREVDEQRALEVLVEAGERAYGLAAHDEAARHFGAALPFVRDGKRPDLLAYILERLGESWEPLGETAAALEVWAEAVADREQAGDVRGVARLRRRLAFAAQAMGDVAGARHHLRAGIETLREQPPSDELVDLYAASQFIDTAIVDPDRAREGVIELGRVAAVLASPRATATSLLAEASLLWLAGFPGDDPAPKALEAARIAAEAGEWLLARRAHRELGWIALVTGRHDAMRAHCQAQIEIDQRLGDRAHQSGPLQQLSLAELMAGQFDRSLALAEEATAHARRYDQRRALTMSLGAAALALAHQGDLDAAEERRMECAKVFPERMTDPRGGWYFVVWAGAMLALERGDAAAILEMAWPFQTAMDRRLTGAAQVLVGDVDGALANAAVLRAWSPPSTFALGVADRLVGLVHQARGETDVAREHFERSAATLASVDLPFEAAVSHLHAGTVDSVREALGAFETMGAARYVDKARQTLRGLGVRVPSPRSGRGDQDVLSRREREVAGLVGEGLSNAEVAQRLVLSVRTVETHLANIYGRLGISSRAALAAWVTAAGQMERGT